jgi:hypothetical protein
MSLNAELDHQIAEAVDRKLDEKLRQIIREEITALAPVIPHQCKFGITPEDMQSVSRYVKGVTRITPTGDLDDGFDAIRSNHQWIAGLRQGGAKAGAAFIIVLLSGAAAAFLAMLWEGFRRKVLG